MNDDAALAALAALYDLQMAVPDVVSAIGHDNTMVAELTNYFHRSRPVLNSSGLGALSLLQ